MFRFVSEWIIPDRVNQCHCNFLPIIIGHIFHYLRPWFCEPEYYKNNCPMADEYKEIQQLQQSLDELLRKHEAYHAEILQLKQQIDRLKKESESTDKLVRKAEEPIAVSEMEHAPAREIQVEENIPDSRKAASEKVRPGKSNLERFIGENLINKIGIAITIIGVAIGAKYAIDHRLINPVTRIILGYLIGLVLLFFAYRLKKNYKNYSAVLLSGSMAIMYLITYAAYSLFNLYPQSLAFLLMVLFTAYTVGSALQYNREVIAIIGMVGAYAVPFLLSEGSGKVAILFSYIAIINGGILVIAVKKYWKPLYFSAFVLSWLIFFSWYAWKYQPELHFTLAIIFLTLFFVTFYLTFLSYKLLKKEKFDVFDILLLLSNSFIFYGIGYALLHHHPQGEHWLGLFTLMNALVHLLVSAVIYPYKLADRNLFYMVSGLVFVFITIAIPVQFSGNWITLLWICEALLLFLIGRTRNAPVYEFISYPLILFAFVSLLLNWLSYYADVDSSFIRDFNVFLNPGFYTSAVFCAALGLILLLHLKREYISPVQEGTWLAQMVNYMLPGMLILVLYFTFRNELAASFNHAHMQMVLNQSPVPIDKLTVENSSNGNIKSIWLVNFSMMFFALLAALNAFRFRNMSLGLAAFWLNVITLLVFLFKTLYDLSELRFVYLTFHDGSSLPHTTYFFTRYITYIFGALPLAAMFLWIKRQDVSAFYKIFTALMLHLCLLWVLSSELLNIMDYAGNKHSYKFGLSIIWGVYALLLIIIGIRNKARYLRIAAMSLLGVTLVKLFFYDISTLDTLLKTALFLALGFLLLVISFLYNKYKKTMFGDE